MQNLQNWLLWLEPDFSVTRSQYCQTLTHFVMFLSGNAEVAGGAKNFVSRQFLIHSDFLLGDNINFCYKC